MAETKTKKSFLNSKHYDADFSNQDLSRADFRGCTLIACNFDNSDLSYASFEGANCWRSTFRKSKFNHTSFKDASLAEAVVDPSMMKSMTITVARNTFEKAQLGDYPLLYWMYMPIISAAPYEIRSRLKELIVGTIGEEKFNQLISEFE